MEISNKSKMTLEELKSKKLSIKKSSLLLGGRYGRRSRWS